MTDIAVIILGAGKGTRMKSHAPKVLHKLAGRSLLGHVLSAVKPLNPQALVLVVGPDMPDVVAEAQNFIPTTDSVIQSERLGTGHAVRMAQEKLHSFKGVILIAYGDVPLITTASLKALVAAISDTHGAAILAFEAQNPEGYGRILQSAQGGVQGIREELDATNEEKEITICNSGIIAIKSELLWPVLAQITNHNAKQEYYLTDAISLLVGQQHQVGLVLCAESEVAGVNDRLQLSQLEQVLQHQYRIKAMLGGVTLQAPETVYFSADTQLGTDITIEPFVVFGPGVRVENHVQIFAHCHIEGAIIGQSARIGPYARLRPGAEIGEDAHIGNFVEIKKAKLGKAVKANHLAYIGDAVIGSGSNIGAGTITCNYDGFGKYMTSIGERVFIGSNTSLVAPVQVGAGALVAAGSVVTDDIPPDALGISRAKQEVKLGWAKRFRQMKDSLKLKGKN